MPEEQKKFFDIARPHQVSPSASGKPVIVGHHPTIPDPMMRPSHASSEPTPETNQTQPSVTESALTTPLASVNQTAPDTPQPIGSLPTNQPTEPLAQSPEEKPTQHHALPLGDTKGSGSKWSKRLMWVLIALLLIFVGAYLAVDSGAVYSNINLPFHIFKQGKENNTSSQPTATNSSSKTTTTAAIPAGFSQYKDSAIPFIFNYPDAWGMPTAAVEPGFSKRGGDNKSDGTYAIIINFANNKDVQVVATSNKYLPAARGTLYYDYGQWCVQSDGKYYKNLLRFTTAGGVDTAGLTVCDQGPLTDVSKLTNAIIVQANTKDPGGNKLGDVYTANLDSSAFPVLRVKDAAMNNSTSVKILLGSIH